MGGHNKKTLEQLKRSGSYRPSRHRHLLPTAHAPEPEAFYGWLEGLSGRALWEGRRFLEHCIPADGARDRLRTWLISLAEFERTRHEMSIETLGREHDRITRLLADVKWRWR
jgi:hypothetical protein